MASARMAVGPTPTPWVADAIRSGGGLVVEDGEPAEGLVWVSPVDTDGLARWLADRPTVRWVQLPFAGVENFLAAGLFDAGPEWTCAKGCYAEPVAEHALLLALAGLRELPRRVRAHRWEEEAGTVLWDQPVTVLGGGGITTALLSVLAPFRCPVTVVRRSAEPVAGAARTLPTARLREALPGALVVFVALALTPETEGIIGAAELAAMDRQAWLVNVARGGHVDTTALLAGLREGQIAGAALDVTDPEPLPADHPLWDEPRCIITPHSADTWDIRRPLLSKRIRLNVERFAAGQPLVGVVDRATGY